MTSVQQYSIDSNLPSMNLDTVIPPNVLNRRRHAISSTGLGIESLYSSEPRMKRRNAISYENDDSAAKYIRFLGRTAVGDATIITTTDALISTSRPANTVNTIPRVFSLPELPNSYKLSPSISRRRGRRGSFQQTTPSKCYRDTLKGSAVHRFDCEGQARIIQDTLIKIDSWDFDVFAVRRITEGRPLFYIGLHLLQRHNVLNLDILKTMKFLAMVEEAYHPDNYYHNGTHAADVTQALHCLLSEPKLKGHLTPIESTAAILAAICHDLDHPGVNQNFLVNTSDYLAAIHGGSSILERHHCHTAKAVVKSTGLLDHLTPEHRFEIMSLMEDLILATDVSRHTVFMTQLEEMIISPSGLDFSKKETRHFILMIAIKAADISNPTRSLPISRAWSEHIMEEFFRQGDNERSMKLPISFMCDRTTTAIPKSQSGFFEYVALPLFKAWSKIFNSRLSLMLCKNIVRNKEYWDSRQPKPESDSEDSS
ncbi:high affinity 3',5'-cyclic-AMP phosphodiesterase 7A-like [Halichondria panicea]|uniref:high affinity 3',5'-cyclic-AMP phosphodiesterase 7A-like n=1 Tax=Halichondria panicea TaxID=6063 RepID=UPI00312B71FF